ncbi:hypothetical protein EDD15DRAFT_2343099, partial [Pisolithus albus]
GVWLTYGGYSSGDDELSDWLTEVDEEELPEIESAATSAGTMHAKPTPCPSCGHQSPMVTKNDTLLDKETENEVDVHEIESKVCENLKIDSKRSTRSKHLTLEARSQVPGTNIYISGDTLPTGSRKYTFGTIETRDEEALQLSGGETSQDELRGQNTRQNVPKTPIQPPEHPYEITPTHRHQKREKTEPENVIRRGGDSQETYQGHFEAKRSLRSCETSQKRARYYLEDPTSILGESPLSETDWGGSDSSSVAARRVAR